MPARLPGQSLLDYLWVNFGEHYVSDTLEENGIPSSKLLLELVNNVANSAINNLRVVDDQLIGYNKEGGEVFSMNVSEISNEKTVVAFGKRYITQEDIDKGCVYSKGTPVYSLLFSDDSELVAKIDEYQGEMTNSVAVDVNEHFISARLRVDNETSVVPIKETRNGVLADLNISPNVESIEFVKEFEGLKARILLDNEGKTLKFKYLTLTEYLEIEEPDPTTVYFLHGKKYFYFGRYLIGVTEDFLVDYYTKEETDTKLDKINDVLYDTMDVGNAVLVNKRTLEKVSVPPENLTNYSPEEWEPIGVVVIPTAHDVYGTGEAGVMALRDASLVDPDNGSVTDEYIYWGENEGEEYDLLITYDKVNTISSDTVNNILSSIKSSYLPSDAFSGELSLDKISKYELLNLYDKAPSPYNPDGSRNECYFTTKEITTINPIYGLEENTTTGINIIRAHEEGSWDEENEPLAKNNKSYTTKTNGDEGYLGFTYKVFGKKGKITIAYKQTTTDNDSGLYIFYRGNVMLDLRGQGTTLLNTVTIDIPDEYENQIDITYSTQELISATNTATIYIDGGKSPSIVDSKGLVGSGSKANALSDFNGKSNTEFFCSKATALTDWKTRISIPEHKDLNITWEGKLGDWIGSSLSEAYDNKKFTCRSNNDGNSGTLRCTILGTINTITFKCKSGGESHYNYLNIGELDTPCTRDSYKYSMKDMKGITKEYTFDISDNNEHYIEFYYSKDGHANAPEDNAEVYISNCTGTVIIPTVPAIDNKSTTGYHPAACACWRYHTIGTEQGDWFLPACGELGYAVVRNKKINTTIESLQNIFKRSFKLLKLLHWSSSKYSTINRILAVYNGYITVVNFGCFTRPFLRLSFNKNLSFYTKPEIDKKIEESLNRSLITFVVQDSDTNVESDITIYSNGTHTVYDREEYTYYDYYGYNKIDLYGQWDIDET